MLPNISNYYFWGGMLCIALVAVVAPFHGRNNGAALQHLPEILENLAICTDTNPSSLCISKFSEQIVAVCGKSSQSQTFLSRCLRTVSTREATQLVEAVECAYQAQILDLAMSPHPSLRAVHPAIGAAVIIFTVVGANCLVRTFDMHMRATVCLRKLQNLRRAKCKTRGVLRRTSRFRARRRVLEAAAFLEAAASPVQNRQDQAYATHTEAVLNFDSGMRACAADTFESGDTLPHRQGLSASIIVPSNIVLVLLDLAGNRTPHPGDHGNNKGERILSFDISTAAGRERWKNYVRLKMTDRGINDASPVSLEL